MKYYRVYRRPTKLEVIACLIFFPAAAIAVIIAIHQLFNMINLWGN